ncbi:hypothetical protein POPTR_001G227800v4 [Populus trichocarpa]|uniref:Uncharacterized protein n=1 Tax=Populus trichocarpa TaxID=3694 RepID=A0A2K2C247_POPTR|nr:hypothetical protein POPTR_001G227800v4 [Populus trichocarpa]
MCDSFQFHLLSLFSSSLKEIKNKWHWRLDWQEEMNFVLIMQISMGLNPMYSAMSWVFSRRQSFRVVGVLGKF